MTTSYIKHPTSDSSVKLHMMKAVVKRKEKVLFENTYQTISNIFSSSLIRNVPISSIQTENILKDINFTCAQLKIFNFRKVEIYATEFFKFSPNLLLIWKWECASNSQETKLSTCEYEKVAARETLEYRRNIRNV